MTDVTDAPDAGSLAARPPGASVIAACLEAQQRAGRRSRLADILGLSPLTDDAEPWYRGALGEQFVGRELQRLDPAIWTVLHAVPVGKRDSDIDHVVIGPAGVFTINTKHHAGQRVSMGRNLLFVGGQATNHVRNSQHEGERASRLLSEAAGMPVVAHPVLAIVDPKEIAGDRRPGGVQILDATRLVRWLNRQEPIWDPDATRAVAEVAQRPETWRRGGVSNGLDEQNAAEFAELRRVVQRMERRQALWRVVGVLAVLGAAWGGLEMALKALAG